MSCIVTMNLTKKHNKFEQLLDEGLEIDEVDENGKTLLDHALQNSNFLFAIRLLHLGAGKTINIDYPNEDGLTLLDFAVSIQDYSSLMPLISLNAKINPKTSAALRGLVENNSLSPIPYTLMLNPADEASSKFNQLACLMRAKEIADIKRKKIDWEKAILELEPCIKAFTLSDSYNPKDKANLPLLEVILKKIRTSFPDVGNLHARQEFQLIGNKIVDFLQKIKIYNTAFPVKIQGIYDSVRIHILSSKGR